MKYFNKLLIRLTLILLISYSLVSLIVTPITIGLSYWLLRLLKYEIIWQENLMHINGYVVEFTAACIAVSAYYLLMILILSTKDLKLVQSLKLFLYGGLLILAVNLIRIAIIISVLVVYGVNYFEAIHLIFWTLVASVYVALVWLFLTKKMKIKTIPAYSDIKYLYTLAHKNKKSKK